MTSKQEWQVVSIDPAGGGSKSSVVFNGAEFDSITAIKLPAYMNKKLDQECCLLVCWDSPLTGPPSNPQVKWKSAYSTRGIEYFFTYSNNKFKVPAGISVLGYSGCSHWAVTQAAIGLPRFGEYFQSATNKAFNLIHEWSDVSHAQKCIVEIHPAVAIWLWCRTHELEMNEIFGDWKYKKSSELREWLWNKLVELWRKYNIGAIDKAVQSIKQPKDDDQMDAFVGWVLGYLLANDHHDKVVILGNEDTGSFLLPKVEGLCKEFNQFLKATFNK